MGERKFQIIVLVILAHVLIINLQIALSVPVPSREAGRSFRSVNSRRRTSSDPWDEDSASNLLHSQQKYRPDGTLAEPFARRENKTGDGTSTFGGGGASSGGVIGANGTLSGNDTQLGSRLGSNESEPCNLEPNTLCSVDSTYPNRDKQRRIAHIVNFFMENVFGNRTRPDVMKQRFSPPSPSSSPFSGDLESIPVSCDLPTDIDSDVWTSDEYLNLYFNLGLKYPDVVRLETEQNHEQPLEQSQSQSDDSGQSNPFGEYPAVTGTLPSAITTRNPTIPVASTTSTSRKTVSVISAKLRLYKIGLSETNNVPSYADIVPSEPCNDTDRKGVELLPSVLPTTDIFPAQLSPSSEEKIRVSIFWYTHPAKKNHYKKKLLDAKMLSLGESEWVEFDIKKAATAWLNDRKPNYGIVVEVENENEDTLDARKYFRASAPCTKSSSLSTPGELLIRNDQDGDNADGTQADDANDNLNNDSRNGRKTGGEISISTSPMLEICTLNVPDMTNLHHNTRRLPFPSSINMHSFDHLQQIADSHAQAKSSSSQTRQPWQSVNLRGMNLSPDDFRTLNNGNRRNSGANLDRPTTTVVHKHRHHHQQHRLNSQNDNTDSNLEITPSASASSQIHGHSRPILDDDHPLRGILATVNGNSKESNRRSSPPNHDRRYTELGKGISEMPAADEAIGSGRGIETDYNVDSSEHDGDVFITKIVIRPNQLKETGLNGMRGLFPFPTPISPAAASPATELTRAGALVDR